MEGREKNVQNVSRAHYFPPTHEIDTKINYLYFHNCIDFINILWLNSIFSYNIPVAKIIFAFNNSTWQEHKVRKIISVKVRFLYENSASSKAYRSNLCQFF